MTDGLRAAATVVPSEPTPDGRERLPAGPLLQLALPASEFDVLESKIAVPPSSPGAVSRTALVNRLRAAAPIRLVTVAAPAGYGKTTLASQWVRRDPRRFAWVTLDERDNDPLVLLRHLAAALDRVERLDAHAVAAVSAPAASIWASAVPRLAAALSERSPIVLVLDDFGALRARASLEIVTALIENVPEGSVLATIGRVAPRLPLARHRASGGLLEFGPADLAMSNREATLLLRSTGVALDDDLTAELVEVCEGWPAALQLAALSVRDGRKAGYGRVRFRGDDRYLADYVRSEYLSHLRPARLRFLRRTSILARLTGPLCDAVLERAGSAAELERIEQANVFLIPLDSRREWYRHHRLLRELLQRELSEQEPELVPLLQERAAEWLRAHGEDESAFDHAWAAGDRDGAATILAALAFSLERSGRHSTLERWLERFEHAGMLERYPAVALHGCRVRLLGGRAAEAERWLGAIQGGDRREAVAELGPSIAVLRAWFCHAGARQMLADADRAVGELPASSPWRPSALAAQGTALILLGEDERADEALAAAAASAEEHGAADVGAVALSERALLAGERGAVGDAEERSYEADRVLAAAVEDDVSLLALGHAVASRVLLRRGRWNEARARLTAARHLLPRLTVAIPWLAVQTRIELVHGLVALRDRSGAEELLNEADEILRAVPDLGVLTRRAEKLRGDVDLLPETDGARTAGLTPAELRLLPLLATHLSFREIAEHLYVSRNTVKTQAISVYRKLGVSSRSEAIAAAQRLGLGERLRVLISDGR